MHKVSPPSPCPRKGQTRPRFHQVLGAWSLNCYGQECYGAPLSRRKGKSRGRSESSGRGEGTAEETGCPLLDGSREPWGSLGRAGGRGEKRVQDPHLAAQARLFPPLARQPPRRAAPRSPLQPVTGTAPSSSVAQAEADPTLASGTALRSLPRHPESLRLTEEQFSMAANTISTLAVTDPLRTGAAVPGRPVVPQGRVSQSTCVPHR